MARAPAHKAEDPGLNPGPGENLFSLKLTTQDVPDGYSEKLIFIIKDVDILPILICTAIILDSLHYAKSSLT